MRRVRAGGVNVLRVSIALTVAASVSTGLAASASGAARAKLARGTLSATEFLQLSTQVAQLQTALDKKDVNWKVAEAACRKAGRSTGLLRSQRDYCLQSVTVTRVVYALESHSLKCAADARGAAATPTTTAPATTATTPALTTTPSPTTTLTTAAPTTATTTPGISAAQLKDVSCLNADYRAIGRAAQPFYRAMMANRKLVLARGFKGACFKVLGDSSANVRKVERFAFAARHAAADAALMTKVFERKAPASSLNPDFIADDGRSFETAVRAVETTKSSEKISACPHS